MWQEKFSHLFVHLNMQEILFIAQKIMHAVVFVSKKSRAFERKCPDQVLRKCRLSTRYKK